MGDVTDGIRDYLASGGLFNPELMDHQRVRDLLIESRDEIERLRGLLRECDGALGWQGHDGSCLDQSFNDYDPDCQECRLLMRVREALGECDER